METFGLLVIGVLLIAAFVSSGNVILAFFGILILGGMLYQFITGYAQTLVNKIKWNYYEKHDVESTTVHRLGFHKEEIIDTYKRVEFIYIEANLRSYGILRHTEGFPVDEANWIFPTVCALPRNNEEALMLYHKCDSLQAESVLGLEYYVHVPRR